VASRGGAVFQRPHGQRHIRCGRGFFHYGSAGLPSASAFLVTQRSVTSLKSAPARAPAPLRRPGGRRGRGRGGSRQPRRQRGAAAAAAAAAAGAAEERALALSSAVPSDESSAEAMLRRFFDSAPNSKQTSIVPESGASPGPKKSAPPQTTPALLRLSLGPALATPSWRPLPRGLACDSVLAGPKGPPRLDPAVNGMVADGVVSRMARSNLLALADAYLANHTVLPTPRPLPVPPQST